MFRVLVPRIPRVVPDQKFKFNTNDVLTDLAVNRQIVYIGHKDKPQNERCWHFSGECSKGEISIVFKPSGIHCDLFFNPSQGLETGNGCTYDKYPGKIHFVSPTILNGVCVKVCGWLDSLTLDGVAYLEYDEENASKEHERYYGVQPQPVEARKDLEEWQSVVQTNNVKRDDRLFSAPWRPWLT